MRPKKELIRIVRTKEENVEIDPTGKRSGRGAYVCSRRACVQKAIKAKSISKALKCSLPKEVIEFLRRDSDRET
jgi:hypothetical protein